MCRQITFYGVQATCYTHDLMHELGSNTKRAIFVGEYNITHTYRYDVLSLLILKYGINMREKNDISHPT